MIQEVVRDKDNSIGRSRKALVCPNIYLVDIPFGSNLLQTCWDMNSGYSPVLFFKMPEVSDKIQKGQEPLLDYSCIGCALERSEDESGGSPATISVV